eukprot:06433.XXX_263224_246743_1 [CDS] Oithona nana genome sequencing.
MAPAAAGIPLTAGTPFATAGAPNGGVPSITQAAVAGGASLHHAHNFAAAAAAAAAAQQQQQHQHQHQHQQQHQQNAVLGSPFTLATSLKPSTVSVPSTSVIISSNTGTGSSPVTTTTAAKTGSPAAKKFRPAFARPSHKSSRYIPKPIPQELGNLKTYSSPDILICGNCREMFSDLVDMMEHKRDYCKLRFTCKCDALNEENDGSPCTDCTSMPSSQLPSSSQSSTVAASTTVTNHGSNSSNTIASTNALSTSSITTSSSKSTRPKWLHCVNCKSPFGNAWDLMVHVQTAHMMNIYQLADTTKLQNQQQQQRQTSPASSPASSALSSLPVPVTEQPSANSAKSTSTSMSSSTSSLPTSTPLSTTAAGQ